MATTNPDATLAGAQPTAGSTPEPTPGLMARFVGIITSPRATYEAVARNPRWLGMAALIILISLVLTVWFQSTEVGRQAALDAGVRMMESFGVRVSDAQYAEMEKAALSAPVWRLALQTALGVVIVAPLMWAAIAGLLYGLFTVTGGTARYKQVFAVLVHSAAISTVGQVFSMPLNYLRESTSSVTNLSVFFPMLPEGGFLARLLGMVDLFMVWWVASLSIGLAVLYRRKTRGVAILLFAIYAVIAIGIAAFFAMRSVS